MMKALVYTAPETFSVTEVPTPQPRGTEVLICVRACGLCKTDVHIHQGKFFSAFPLIPGHEFAGEVAAVGDQVARVQVGDRVVADNERQCGSCYYCRRGEPLFCENLYAQGVNAPGGFAEYVLVEEQQVYPLADDISFDEGALVEPTACAVHGLDVIRPQAGDEVLQFGVGPTGLILAQLLRHGGAATLVAVDLSPAKLALASRWADAIGIQVHPDHPQAYIPELKQRYPHGFDIVVDATGVPPIIQSLPQFAKYGSKVVVYGVAPEEATIQISPYEIFRRELTILGSFSQAHTFERATRLVNSHTVKVKEMVTHTLPLEEWGYALQMVKEGRENIKIVMTP
ncbi:MAG: zinc-dependent alcohol dehydrogenase family protein [Armatimonadota bacterium]